MATEFAAANFTDQVLKSDKPVVVDFWAEWCGPCKMLGPVIEQLAKEYEGKVVVGKVDVDSNQELAAKFGISSIPAVMLFKDGKVVAQTLGFKPLPAMKQWLDSNLH